MIPHLEEKRKIQIRKLVSNAKAIISNQVGLSLGASKMVNLLNFINQIEPLTNIDLTIFKEYYSKINQCPIGTERLFWEKEALKKQDLIIDKVSFDFKDLILDKCFEIIKTFDK